jgi:predicted ATPase
MRLPIEQISIRHLLSFGELEPFEFAPLNVIVGPNGSGKSNLIETIGLLASLPQGLNSTISNLGGIFHWLWKGVENPVARIQVHGKIGIASDQDYEHSIEFGLVNQSLRIVDESVSFSVIGGKRRRKPLFEYESGTPILRDPRKTTIESGIDRSNSILWREQPAWMLVPLDSLSRLYRSFRIYRGRSLNHVWNAKQAQPADQFGEFLLPDARNLGAVLNRMMLSGPNREILGRIQGINDNIDDLVFSVENGTLQIYLRETGLIYPIPASRISDGTFRWLCLIAILLNPTPPPLLCLEEPEIGLHPDMVVELASLLQEASQRTQLIVTTHSDTLVDALSDDPGSVIVCEKLAGQTTLQRLKEPELRKWLAKYGLGEIWRRNQIGGNRW